MSMILNPQAVTVYQLLFMLNTYLRPKQTEDPGLKKVLVTTFQNVHSSTLRRNPQNRDTLIQAGMVDRSIVIVKSEYKELTINSGWKLDVDKGEKAPDTIIMGRPRSPQDFHKKKAGQYVYAGGEDNYFDYLEEETLNENRNNKNPYDKYLNQTKEDIDNVAKETIVLFVFALLI